MSDFIGPGAPDTVEINAGLLEQTADVLLDIVEADPDSDLADKIEDAINKLDDAISELEKMPPDLQAAIGSIEGAVDELDAAVQAGLLNSLQGAALMDDLAAVARLIATDAIGDAQGGDPDKIAEAEQSLSDGDVFRTSSAYKDAVAKYKDALAIAEGA